MQRPLHTIRTSAGKCKKNFFVIYDIGIPCNVLIVQISKSVLQVEIALLKTWKKTFAKPQRDISKLNIEKTPRENP
jgi:hypothetical protein